jgi:endogenous inhibitor of DNA gyrase (YacG/DUF329 family)
LIDFDKWASEEYRVPGQRINISELPESPPPGNEDESPD